MQTIEEVTLVLDNSLCNTKKFTMPAEENKLFVGGLPHDADDSALKKFAETWGVVTDAKIMMDRMTQRSRGFGFITFEEVDAVQTILRCLFDHVCYRRQSEAVGIGILLI